MSEDALRSTTLIEIVVNERGGYRLLSRGRT